MSREIEVFDDHGRIPEDEGLKEKKKKQRPSGPTMLLGIPGAGRAIVGPKMDGPPGVPRSANPLKPGRWMRRASCQTTW